jgi:hypothetical protein
VTLAEIPTDNVIKKQLVCSHRNNYTESNIFTKNMLTKIDYVFVYYFRQVTVGLVTNDKLFGYAARILPGGAWKPLHAIEIDLEPGTPGVRPVIIKEISLEA